MLNAQFYTDTIAAGATIQRLFVGAYFNIISATGIIDARTDRVNLKGLTAGQGFEKQPFQRIEITNATGATNTIRYVIADEGFIAGLTGSVSIASTEPVLSSNFANTNPTVTNASAVLVAANQDRKYLTIQNNDTVGNVFVQFGAAATLATGLKIGPGGAFEMSDVQSTQNIYAIGSIASNANVIVVQG